MEPLPAEEDKAFAVAYKPRAGRMSADREAVLLDGVHFLMYTFIRKLGGLAWCLD
jgi:hypothetical protein